MAEFVQQSIEEMLPELEQMERVGLFSGGETRAILKKRTGYEYKLRRRTRQKEDYLQYIQYEINVMALVKKRRQKTGYNFKKMEIDIAIVQRIHRMFKLACLRFQEDIKLWLSHIEFCKSLGEKVSVGRLFTKMLQIHSREPGLWILAAKWELEKNMFMDNARSLLQRGLRFNHSSKKLWLEYFRMELLNCEKMLQRKKVLGMERSEKESAEMSDVVLQGRVALVVFKKAMEAFPDDVEFWISFLPICRLFHMDQLEEEILQDVQESHPRSEFTWHALAQRYLYRASLPHSDSHHTVDVTQAEDKCFAVYDEAVERLNTERMWTLYMKACLERLQTAGHNCTQTAAKCVDVFNRAIKDGRLSEEVVCDWLEVLKCRGDLAEMDRVSGMAVDKFPRSVSVWTHRLDVLILTSADHRALMQCLDAALLTIRENDWLPLWDILFKWCLLNSADGATTEALLERGVQAGVKVCVVAKECYLEWAVQHRDIAFVRQLYKRLSSAKPLSVNFFRKYLEIEQAQTSSKIKRQRRGYEDALSEYGSNNTDLWLDYIRLEMSHKNGSPENAGSIHWRALKALTEELVQTFVTEYTLMQTGHL